MENFRIAVKAFIIKDGKALLIKRRSNDAHKPGQWDIPGGRMEFGENPLDGVLREAKEEVSLDIAIVFPLLVQHFTRDDGQTITMIIFLCKPLSDSVKLSEEHAEYRWVSAENEAELFPAWLLPVRDNFLRVQRGIVI
ncbi:MAG: NUDIX domain-containing protein [Candidatus Wildermuthbacteria bacterium]|nr:NUDIX domain-containing protein [Candidatus Wildermuthbacteria bacterium]